MRTSITAERPVQRPDARADDPVLEIRDLAVWYDTPNGPVEAVRNVSLSLARGESLGIVGESGCGKSSLAFAILGYLGRAGRTAGEIRLAGENLLGKSERELRAIRGSRLALVYQDPLSTLNPSLTVGEQIAEVYRTHRGASRADAWARAVQMLGKVGLGKPEAVAVRYPHQLSGGMQQRVVIAMALCCDPDVLILDEPTTALDVTTEARVLDLVQELQREFHTAALYISHNLGVIAQVCDRVAVMYAGRIVEEAMTRTLFRQPRHPYTVGLLGAVPRLGTSKTDAPLHPIPGSLESGRHAMGCAFAPRCGLARDRCQRAEPPLLAVSDAHSARCHFWSEVPDWAADLSGHYAEKAAGGGERLGAMHVGAGHHSAGSDDSGTAAPLLQVRDVTKYFGEPGGLGRIVAKLLGQKAHPVRAVDRVSFDVQPGQTLALVGESGCGKTTLGRTIAGLTEASGGTITFVGEDISQTAERRQPELRRQIQMVFQNPEASLNPRQTVGQALERPLRLFLGLRGQAAKQRVVGLLRSVNLDPSFAQRYPSQLSGGEKQRVAIARAFAGEPRLVVLDEPVSALDVSVQAAVLNLLVNLQRQRGTAYLFIGHDLSVVRYVADQIGVIYLGQLCEFGRAEELFRPPYHPYTEALLSSVPVPDPEVRQRRIHLDGAVPSAQDPPRGCPFHTRCPRKLGAICETTPPPTQVSQAGHAIRCHIPLEELTTAQVNRGGADATARPVEQS